jgi:hypothetical protein
MDSICIGGHFFHHHQKSLRPKFAKANFEIPFLEAGLLKGPPPKMRPFSEAVFV